MKIHYNKDFECYMVAECHKTDVIELDGVKLIPITELENIKVEIRNKKDGYGKYPVCDNCIKIIDRHIAAEPKG